MRAALAITFLLAGLGLVNAGDYYGQPRPMPHPGMNYHCPYYINCIEYWHPGPYGIAGPTDRRGQPVDGIGVPPFGPPPRSRKQEQGPMWHRHMRSPRDFFMVQQ